ncbi:FAD-binding domain-containing protein [Mycena floridula]|nr:FAD-binding domain-containing protein [Mycena floridula]
MVGLIPLFLLALASISEAQLASIVCLQIASTISSASQVFLPGSLGYVTDIFHWASSSSDTSACSVEPGSTADVGKILQLVGSTRTPFAIKGGGHTANPGFSSTPGVHISMSRFADVIYNATTQTATIGAGLIWDDVYGALEPLGVNVVGGRFSGVGVAGYSLGGGYSWKSNQFGLTVDNIVGYELVLPNGTVADVTANHNPDLFFGLKGGFNNFGIVTRFIMKTYPQTQVWGGLIIYTIPEMAAVNAAVATFSSSVIDPKAQIFSAYNGALGVPLVGQILFYDAPTPPPGIFDNFLSIPFVTKDIGTRSFASIVKVFPTNITTNARSIFDTVPVTRYTPALVDAILNETTFWSAHLAPFGGLAVSFDIEPFLPAVTSPSNAPTAFPPIRSTSLALCPTNFFFVWTPGLVTADSIMQDAVRQSVSFIKALAISEGVLGNSKYPNYAIYDTPLSDMYGANVPRLQSTKKSVDPQNVMGLAGGFKF